jgi:peptide/nickel transport system substrate-binding protein
MRSRIYALSVICLVLAVMLVSCGGTAESPTTKPSEPTKATQTTAPAEPTKTTEPTVPPQPTATEEPVILKDELTIADALASVTLDPHKDGFSQADTEIIVAVHDRLVDYKGGVPGAEIEGRLATEWSVSPDGLVWTFQLRKGVVWQGGYGPFTAQDVVYTYERLMDPNRSLNAGLVAGVISSVEAVGDYTVEIHVTGPIADFVPQVLLNYRTGSILSKAAVEAIGDDNYAREPIGTGPYQVVERAPGQRTVLERNPGFWGEQPAVSRFVFVDIPEESTRMNALVAGQVDIISVRAPINIEQVVSNPNLVVDIMYDRPAMWTLWISDLKVPDVRVREAIALAIDKHELAETVLENRSNPNVVSYNAPGLVGFPDDATEELYPYDPTRAKALLAEAGIRPGELTLKFPTRADFLELSQAIQGYLDAIGIKVDMEVQEQALFRQSIRSAGQLFDITNVFPSRATTTEMLAYYGAKISTSQYEAGIPPRVAELYDAQMKEMDVQRRAALVRELIAIVEKDIPWVVMGYAGSAATVHPPFVSGPFINYVSEFYLPLEYIKIDQKAYAEWSKKR